MPAHKFRKGDLVRFRFGARFVEGMIKEERGPIGVKGRHLFRVSFRPSVVGDDIFELELPAVDMELVQEKVSTSSVK